jgi:hypothetical protein
MRSILKNIASILGAAVLALAVLVVGIVVLGYFILRPTHDEVASVPSPDGRLVAKVVEIDGGATTSFAYEVRLTEKGAIFEGKQVAYLYGAVRNPSAYGVNLRWRSPSELSVEYLKAQAVTLDEPEWHSGASTVKVVLTPEIEDETAPSGGMLYNVQKGNTG